MRKLGIILGIVISTSVVIMLINVLISATQNGFNWGNVDRIPENIRKQDKIDLNKIETIKLNFKSSDLKVMITDEPELKVIQYSNKELKEKELFYISKSENEITVKENKKSVNFGIGIFGINNVAYDIYIPKNYEGIIYIESVSGNINIDNDMNLNNAEVKTTSGDIVFSRTVYANKLKVKTVSGDIKLENINADELVLESTSGDIYVGNTININEIKSVSGDLNIDKGEGKIVLNTTSGDVVVNEFKIKENSKIKTVSGDIKINLNKELGCKIETHTTSGDIRLPNGSNIVGNEPYSELNLHTTSGDIKVE